MRITKRHPWLTPMHWVMLAAITSLISCGGSSNNHAPTPDAQEPEPQPRPEMQSYSAPLEGKQAVPMVQSNQSATASVTINKTDMVLMAEANLSDLIGVSALHLHAGEVGTNGPAIFGFSDADNDGVWMIEDQDITQAQHADLLAGNWYIKVRTDDFPDGELRGQVLTETQSVLVFTLSGDQEVPPVQTEAYGQGYLLYDSSMGALTLNTWAWNLTATAAHIHHAEAGRNGEVVVGWEASADNDDLWQLPETTVLGSNDIFALQMANLYVNIHTDAYPDGEIRGQILPDDYLLILFDLFPEQEVPPVESLASGRGYATLNTEFGGLRLNVWAEDMETTAAHIHQADIGENGDAVIELEQNGDHAGLWQTPYNTALDSGTQALLLTGGHYVNVHSDNFPAGEIRGQIAE